MTRHLPQDSSCINTSFDELSSATNGHAGVRASVGVASISEERQRRRRRRSKAGQFGARLLAALLSLVSGALAVVIRAKSAYAVMIAGAGVTVGVGLGVLVLGKVLFFLSFSRLNCLRSHRRLMHHTPKDRGSL